MTKKRLFLWYAAFAPFIAIALTCQFFDSNDEKFDKIMFISILMTMPLSCWLVWNAGGLAVASVITEIHTLNLTLTYLEHSLQPYALMVLLISNGYAFLYVLDANNPKIKKEEAAAEAIQLIRGALMDQHWNCGDYGRAGMTLDDTLDSRVYPDVNRIDNGNGPS
jgi:hypothetical protein